MYLWVVKIQSCLNHVWETLIGIALLLRKYITTLQWHLFRALALHLHGNKKLEEETSKIFNIFFNNSEERDPPKIQGVHMTDIPKVEDLLQNNVFHYDIDFVDGELIGELCRGSIQKYEKSVTLLRRNNHICYVNNINTLFKTFRCTACDTFFSKRESGTTFGYLWWSCQTYLPKECLRTERNAFWKVGCIQHPI